MRRRTAAILACLCATLGGPLQLAGQEGGDMSSVSSSDLGRRVQVIGPLGAPLGRLIEVRGRRVAESDKRSYEEANLTNCLFEASAVGGKPLPEPVRIDVTWFPFRPIDVPADADVTVVGYQTGSFEHIPEEAYVRMGRPVQNGDWHLRVELVAIEVR